MKYTGNAYDKEELNSSAVSAEVAAQCFCGTHSCPHESCTWN